MRCGRSDAAGEQQHTARRPGPVDQPLRQLPGHEARPRRGVAVDQAAFETLHAYFLDRLVPVCAQLVGAAAKAGEIRPDTDASD